MIVSGPSLTINDVSLNEGNSGTTTYTFTVSLSQPSPTGGVTFNIATQDGTATTANNDYVARSLTAQTIPSGQSTYTFDVSVNGDLVIEPNESFLVNVTNVSGATVLDGQGLGTIQNDDSPALSINDVALSEGNSGTTTFTFTVTSSLPAPAGGISFDIATADGTATSAGGDYVAHSLTNQTIPAGQTSYTFDVTVNGDTLVEPDETLFVNVTNVSANASILDGQGQGTIQNDDTPVLVISQVYGGGGNTGAQYTNDFVEIFNRGTTTVNFAITPYSVQYAGATSTFGSNKVDLASGVITPGHYFLVQLSTSGAIGVALPTPDTTGSINMAATAGKLALVAGTTALGGSGCPLGATIADFVGYGTTADCSENLTRAPAPSNITADFRKAGGCADTNDNAADFLVSAPFPRNTASPANSCTAGTPPNLSINDVTVAEGNSGTTTATFTVSLSAPAQGTDVTFDIATQNNTASSGSDYVARSLTNQVIPAGVQTYSFDVTINGDVTVEPDETFFVNVTNVSSANVIDGQGLGTIQNDDAASSSLTINDVSTSEGNTGTKTLDFTVTLSPASAQTVTVNYGTADGTATTANNDYVATSGLLTVNPGDTTKLVSVTINGDTTVEPDENFFVNLTGATNATIGDAQGQGTITNDDGATPITKVVISQIYGGGGNAGATLKNDFIELFNSGNQTVNLTGWSVQYTSAAGTTWQVTNLAGSITPGQYYLVQEAVGAGGTTNLPTPDATGTIAMAATAGKVALVNTTTTLTGSGCPLGASVVDFIGYGSGTTCSETAAAPAPSNTTADLRAANGCTDVDNNATDFSAGTPNPRNSSTPTSQCPGTIAQPEISSTFKARSGGMFLSFYQNMLVGIAFWVP